MAKKNNPTTTHDDSAENYYDLHTEAVEKLVNATDDTVPEVGADQPDPYKMGFLSKIPNWIKALFIKFWFNGAACFFFLWGLGIYIKDFWSQLLILGVALGIITDVLVNNLFRFMQSDELENEKWMMLPMKAYWTFFVNIVYAMAVLLLVTYTYQGINILIIKIKNLPETSVPLGVEPFLFGVMYLLYDLIFIGVKDAIVHAIRANKAAKCPEDGANASDAQPIEEELSATQQPDEQPTDEPEKPVVIVHQTGGGNKKKHKK